MRIEEGAPPTPDDVRHRLELLVGGRSRAPEKFDDFFDTVVSEIETLDTLTFEQFNKLLLAAGFNRVSRAFFDFFVDDADDRSSSGSFDRSLARWRERVMLQFGNFRYPFRQLSQISDSEVLSDRLGLPAVDLTDRPVFLDRLASVDAQDLPFLGYLASGEINKLRELGPSTEHDHALIERAKAAMIKGEANLYEYCVSEYMDVYVATSMRESEDFYSTARFVEAVFGQSGEGPDLSGLAYFDPTQSTHVDRIIKGMVEGLMLKRSICTVYMAQEKDTLGKDAELATTLVQGKPVVVYVPQVDDVAEQVAIIRADLTAAAADDPFAEESPPPEWKRLADLYTKNLPNQWYETSRSKEGIRSEDDFDAALREYVAGLRDLYERRANFLVDRHPLGVQITLSSGVPNGVLVVRSAEQCRELLWKIIHGDLRFRIEAVDENGSVVPDLEAHVHLDRRLVEDSTGCVYRYAVGESPIANAFWNWYPGAE